MNHFRGGFLHDVSQRSRPFPSFSPRRGRRRGIRSQEVRTARVLPRVRSPGTIFSRQGRRAVIQLRFLRTREFEGFRRARIVFVSPRKLTVATRAIFQYAVKNHPCNYDTATCHYNARVSTCFLDARCVTRDYPLCVLLCL